MPDQPSALTTRIADIDARLLKIAKASKTLHDAALGKEAETAEEMNQRDFSIEKLKELGGRIRFGEPK